jgi:hypothetical protein
MPTPTCCGADHFTRLLAYPIFAVPDLVVSLQIYQSLAGLPDWRQLVGSPSYLCKTSRAVVLYLSMHQLLRPMNPRSRVAVVAVFDMIQFDTFLALGIVNNNDSSCLFVY